MVTTSIMTGPEFDALPYEEGRCWELLGGELIAVPSPTPQHQLILQRILVALIMYFDARPGQGLALSDVEFAVDENHRLRPDVLVLMGERASSLDMTRVPIPGVPDLAVEIISPSERSSETQQKLHSYLRHGTQEVWQVYPKSKSVVVHRGETSTTVVSGERLETLFLPGFSLDLKYLF